MNSKWIVRALKIASIAILVASLLSFGVMSLWNWLMPSLFGWRQISFWQALGLLILSKILFGGFRGRPGYGRHWGLRMMERFEQMTPEEREKFRAGLRSRCGHFPPATERKT